MNVNGIFSSITDNWSTPQDLFNKLNDEFHFTLDPCADDYNHKCSFYYTKEENGLLQDWIGHIVFCNPPYGREIKKWVKKSYETIVDSSFVHKKTVIVMLIPARTDTCWFHDYIYNNSYVEIRFIKGRLRFGNSCQNAPFPSMIVIFRSNISC